MPQARRLGAFNGRGLWELYLKEVRRFLKVYLQTLIAPVITTLIFLAIFVLSIGPDMPRHDVGFTTFLAPGLIMMAMVQNAFANTSSSIMIGKVQGNIVDVLMPPLSPAELTLAFTLGGVTRGLMVGILVAAVMAFFVPFPIHHPFHVVYHAVGASLMLSLLGVLAGVWAEKFDHMASVTNFIITPLSFLSGTFYTIDSLPGPARLLAHLNPFFYMIDGFRYGFIGHDQATPGLGLVVVGVANVGLALGCWAMIRAGYKLKS
ncbi:ABC transporter permease [Pararhodospirillum oryzae]|nr:ABC transporter permease [Pararhodospirillum oryzae]